ncbi:flavin reductase family protein [Dinoroseobacter sp. S76]|uniref:flavin reductase family protein n=1 Tax=Dinoroseobacter sp. S76 TaxID=3415124 RepID=UPI003C7A81E6
MTGFDPKELRKAFGTFMTGVTVVTARDPGGAPLGFTANSFTSVSLDPPLVLVCLATASANYEAFTTAQGFAVNILSEGQTALSNTFARPAEDRFAEVSWQAGPHGAPILDGVSAWFDCAMHQTVAAGDHVVLIGEVRAFDHSPTPGLGYARGAYVTASAEAEALTPPRDMVVSALIERDGQILLQDAGDGSLSLPTSDDVTDGVHATLDRLIGETGLQAEPGFIYAVYKDARMGRHHVSFLCPAGPGAPQRGAFTVLNPSTLMDVADPATCTMLERFADESRLGDFGVYYGNEVTGEVRPRETGGARSS